MVDKISKFIDENFINGDKSLPKSVRIFSTQNSENSFIHGSYKPSWCVVLRGEKEVKFGDTIISYDSSSFVVAPINLTAKFRVTKAPYLGVIVDFGSDDILEILKQFDQKTTSRTMKSLKLSRQTPELLDTLFRLLNAKSDFMVELIKKEILYLLLSGENGEFLSSYVKAGTIQNAISRATHELSSKFSEHFNMEDLAKSVGLSTSSFYSNFKLITNQTPLNFLKQIRLENAKNILLNSDMDAQSVALIVGYESPTQFSREYSRIYGHPPKTHIKILKSQNL